MSHLFHAARLHARRSYVTQNMMKTLQEYTFMGHILHLMWYFEEGGVVL